MYNEVRAVLVELTKLIHCWSFPNPTSHTSRIQCTISLRSTLCSTLWSTFNEQIPHNHPSMSHSHNLYSCRPLIRTNRARLANQKTAFWLANCFQSNGRSKQLTHTDLPAQTGSFLTLLKSNTSSNTSSQTPSNASSLSVFKLKSALIQLTETFDV